MARTDHSLPGVYNATALSLSDGDGAALALDATGALKTYQDGYSYKYQAAAAADVVVKATPGFLHKIIIGADVASGTIEVSDHASDGDGAVKILLTGNTLMTSCGGEITVDAYFATGICADLTNQTNVTFIYR